MFWIISKLQTVVGFFVDPGMHVRHMSFGRRKAYHVLTSIIMWRAIAKRKALASKLPVTALPDVNPQTGWSRISTNKTELEHHLLEAINEALEHFGRFNENNSRVSKQQKSAYLRKVIEHRKLNHESAIVGLARHPALLKVVSNYLGMFPVCSYIGVWHSPNTYENSLQGSQLMHLDHEGFIQLKVFIPCKPITENSGPLLIVDANESLKLQRSLNYKMSASSKRIADDAFAHSKVTPMVAKKGEILMFDSSQCFHAGSRHGTDDRLLIALQYLLPTSYVSKAYRTKIPTHLIRKNVSSDEVLFQF